MVLGRAWCEPRHRRRSTVGTLATLGLTYKKGMQCSTIGTKSPTDTSVRRPHQLVGRPCPSLHGPCWRACHHARRPFHFNIFNFFFKLQAGNPYFLLQRPYCFPRKPYCLRRPGCCLRRPYAHRLPIGIAPVIAINLMIIVCHAE